MSDAMETEGILRIHQALLHLQLGLAPFVAARMEAWFGPVWRDHSRRGAGSDALDAYALLKTMIGHWGDVFAPAFGTQARYSVRSHVTHALEERNTAAHAIGAIPDAAALRAIDAIHELLKAVAAPAATLAAVQALYDPQREPRAAQPPRAAPSAARTHRRPAGTVAGVCPSASRSGQLRTSTAADRHAAAIDQRGRAQAGGRRAAAAVCRPEQQAREARNR
jgi:hypothetical protein